MPDANKPQPVIRPFRNKDGPGWHLIIQYPSGNGLRVDGFETEEEALSAIPTLQAQSNK